MEDPEQLKKIVVDGAEFHYAEQERRQNYQRRSGSMGRLHKLGYFVPESEAGQNALCQRKCGMTLHP